MTLTATAIHEYDRRAMDSDETETATFALGCFWGPDARFGAMDGVVRTRVGYAGGTMSDPTYHDLGGHTEAFQLEYDPDTVTFAELLDRVFQRHDPNHQTRKTQYQNIVFATTPGQSEALNEYLGANGLNVDTIETRVEQLSSFYLAEDYHQKHSLQSRQSFTDAFEEAGYDDTDLRESPAAAKLNGFVAGHDIDAELGVDGEQSVHSR